MNNCLVHFQVLRVVKTRQVTYSVLNHLIEYVQNLEKVGLLEEKEMLHLQDAVQVIYLIYLLCPFINALHLCTKVQIFVCF